MPRKKSGDTITIDDNGSDNLQARRRGAAQEPILEVKRGTDAADWDGHGSKQTDKNVSILSAVITTTLAHGSIVVNWSNPIDTFVIHADPLEDAGGFSGKMTIRHRGNGVEFKVPDSMKEKTTGNGFIYTSPSLGKISKVVVRAGNVKNTFTAGATERICITLKTG